MFMTVIALAAGLGLVLTLGSGTAAAKLESDTIVHLADKAQNGVVNIRTVKVTEQGSRVFRHFFGPFGPQGPQQPEGRQNPFERFFGPFGDDDAPSREFRQRSLGSGFLIDKEGFIVTNNHVVEGADEIQVRLTNGDEFDAELVGRDPKTDLALIRIDQSGDLEPLPWGDSETLEVGQWVVAIGSPFGLEQTVTAGIVSAKGRVIGAGPYDDFIQTDASINPGNSGGPLLDLDGRVVGINTAIVASGQGIGFAIPINLARNIVEQLKETGEVSRGWLGVGIQDLNEELKGYYDVSRDEGVLVTEIYEGQPAAEAGIKPGDVIISVDGEPVADARGLSSLIAGLEVGKKTRIKLVRDGKEKTLTVTLGRRSEGEQVVTGGAPDKESSGELGLGLADLTPQLAERLGYDKTTGVVVSRVEPGSKAEDAGFMRGDLILEMNRKPMESVDDLKMWIDRLEPGDEVRFLIRRPRAGLNVITLTW
jgi:serine protease Do